MQLGGVRANRLQRSAQRLELVIVQAGPLDAQMVIASIVPSCR